jgi:hypothetical protein
MGLWPAENGVVRYGKAVQRLETIAERCQRVSGLWDAVHGYLDLHDAIRARPGSSGAS